MKRAYIKTSLIWVPDRNIAPVCRMNPAFLGSWPKPSGGGGGGGLNIVRKQFKQAYPATSAAFTGATTAGDAIIAVTSGFSTADGGAVTDTQGNTYTLIRQIVGSGGAQMSVYAAFGIVGGADTVTVAASGETDASITIFEYSGTSGIDTSGIDTSGASAALTTTHTAAFFGAWANEASDTYSTPVLTPGTVSAVTINHNATHFDAEFELLNSGSGFSAGSYTVAISGGTGGLVVIALK